MRSDNSGRRERTRPGILVLVCVLCVAVVREGLPLFICLNVFKCSPVPASFFPYLSTALQWIFNINSE